MREETFRDRLQRQIALEEESRALGSSRYRSRRPLPWRNDPSAADEEADLPPGRQLLRLALQPTAEAIREFTDRVNEGGGARTPEAAYLLSEIGAEEAAYLIGRVILSAVVEQKKLTATAIAVADAIIEHIQMANLTKVNRHAAKGVLRNQQTGVRSSKKRRAIQNIFERLGVDRTFNTPILNVIREVWDGGGVLGDLPARNPEPLPGRPHNYDTEETAKARWKREAADVHDRNSKLVSKRLAVSQRLWVAAKFADEVAIYFPHSLDFRGRVYPLATGGPHPQGDDLAKSLLTFAEGHPITDAGAQSPVNAITPQLHDQNVALDTLRKVVREVWPPRHASGSPARSADHEPG